MTSGQLFVISAPSGTGKSTLIQALRGRMNGLGYSVSYTSRKPRGEEKDGTDYHFVSRADFKTMIDREEFVEWAQVFDEYYGTAVSTLKQLVSNNLDVLLDLDIHGARNIRRYFEDSVLIFVLPPSLKVLEERLRKRGTERDENVRARMKRAVQEIKSCLIYDHILINDDLETTVDELRAVVMADRSKARRRQPLVKSLYRISLV
jgi:guanylate kinase